MDDNQHPADILAGAFHDFVNGADFKQGLRDAWDRISGPAQPSAHDQAVQQMNNQATAQRTADATKSFIKPDVAASIRAKANGR